MPSGIKICGSAGEPELITLKLRLPLSSLSEQPMQAKLNPSAVKHKVKLKRWVPYFIFLLPFLFFSIFALLLTNNRAHIGDCRLDGSTKLAWRNRQEYLFYANWDYSESIYKYSSYRIVWRHRPPLHWNLPQNCWERLKKSAESSKLQESVSDRSKRKR